MFEKEIEHKLKEKQKEQARREKRKKRKTPSYKGYDFRNWLVYPLGVISVELDLAHARKYQALEWSEEKAIEIINKYLVEICDYEEETGELSFSTEWRGPWGHYANRKDKLWCSKFNYELTRFLKEKYECEGFKKSFGEGYDSDWIIFTKI
jgi:hypothetical protein